MSFIIHQDDGSYLVTGQAGQDLKDGTALRQLREALRRYDESQVVIRWHDPHWSRFHVDVEYWLESFSDPDVADVGASGATIAEAADKCRAALEAKT